MNESKERNFLSNCNLISPLPPLRPLPNNPYREKESNFRSFLEIKCAQQYHLFILHCFGVNLTVQNFCLILFKDLARGGAPSLVALLSFFRAGLFLTMILFCSPGFKILKLANSQQNLFLNILVQRVLLIKEVKLEIIEIWSRLELFELDELYIQSGNF